MEVRFDSATEALVKQSEKQAAAMLAQPFDATDCEQWRKSWEGSEPIALYAEDLPVGVYQYTGSPNRMIVRLPHGMFFVKSEYIGNPDKLRQKPRLMEEMPTAWARYARSLQPSIEASQYHRILEALGFAGK
jgi:hypothetical protein